MSVVSLQVEVPSLTFSFGFPTEQQISLESVTSLSCWPPAVYSVNFYFHLCSQSV